MLSCGPSIIALSIPTFSHPYISDGGRETFPKITTGVTMRGINKESEGDCSPGHPGPGISLGSSRPSHSDEVVPPLHPGGKAGP